VGIYLGNYLGMWEFILRIILVCGNLSWELSWDVGIYLGNYLGMWEFILGIISAFRWTMSMKVTLLKLFLFCVQDCSDA
jgi:hypothetical protein